MEIISLKKENIKLLTRVVSAEQYSRVNCLELHNKPYENEEDVSSIVRQKVALDYTIYENKLNFHRLHKKNDGKLPHI